MLQITDISPQKRKKERYNVFVNDKFSFAANAEIVLKNNLKVGKNISQELIDKITKEDQSTKLMDRVMNFLSFRPRSEKEIRDYLAKKIANNENIKFNQASQSPLIDQIIKKLKKYHFINDLEFAKLWIASRSSSSNSKGINLVKFELLKKGINKEIVEKVLEKTPNQVNLAQKALEKKIKKWQKLPTFEKKKKIYQFLVNRGFDFETIEEVFAKVAKKS